MSARFTFATLFISILLPGLLIAQPVFEWAKGIRVGGNYINNASYSVLGKSGNLYTYGKFSGSIDMDPGPGTYLLTAKTGSSDMYISCSNKNGELIWAKQLNANNNIGYIRKNIALDSNENVIVTGSFWGTIDIDPGPTTFYLSTSAQADLFILKLDSGGRFLWAKQTMGTLVVASYHCAVDRNNTLYVSGNFSGNVDFDPGPDAFGYSATFESGFVLKLDNYGNFIWARQFSSTRSSTIYEVVIDSSASVYATGGFYDSVDFDPGPGVITKVSKGLSDIFLLKLDSGGSFQWVNCLGSFNNDFGESLTLSREGEIYFTGGFRGTVDFDPGAGTSNLSSTYDAVFVSKFDSKGFLQWARMLGDGGYPGCIRTDPFNNIYTCGQFTRPGFLNQSPKGSNDNYIVKLLSNAQIEWVATLGGDYFDYIFALQVDSTSLYATGYASVNTDFDPDTSTYKLNDSNGFQFRLKWKVCNTSNSIFAITCDSFRLNNTEYYSSGTFLQTLPNARGCDSIITLHLTMAKPKARFITQSRTGCQYVAYSLTDSSEVDTATLNTLMYHWEFGDGTDTTFSVTIDKKHFTLEHIYTQSGTYSIRLFVSNGFCSDTFNYINQVTILPAPKPGFSTSASSWCGLPATLTLTSNTTSNVVRYFYDMGNGDTLSSALPSVQYTYTQPGRYKITQRLMGSTGCVTEDSTFVTLQYGLSAKDTVNVLYTTVPDAGSTRTVWRRLPHAAAYRINGITVTDTFYTALGLNTLVNTYSYTVAGVDSCGNISATAPPSKSMLLTASGSTDNEYALFTYTPYSFWQQGVSNYEIQVQFQNQWRTLANLGSSTLPFKDLHFADTLMQDGNSIEKCYRIIAHENNGNRQQSVSNEACVPFAPVVFIPNAFSPNGDGINDRFAPVILGMNVYYLRIYDRWGQEVYSTSYQNPDEGWDGKVLGQEAKPGIYVWVFSAASRLKSPQYNNPANSIEKRGTVVLVR